MRTLPKPHPDEFAYSALARATYRFAAHSPKAFLDQLFGKRTVVAVPDLPVNLDLLAQSTQAAWGLSPAEIAYRHTHLGYYARFRSRRQRDRLLKMVLGESHSHLHVRLGVCAGAAHALTRFRLCPSCHAADLISHREAYWHRAHHLPGVLVCHMHGDLLEDTEIPFRPTGRHNFVAAPQDLGVSRTKPLVASLAKIDVAISVARKSYQVLSEPWDVDAPDVDYRSRLGQLGFQGGKGGAAALRRAFEAFFGEDMLSHMFRSPQSTAWVAEALRPPRRPLHPLKHVLMDVFIAGSTPAEVREDNESAPKTWGIYRDETLRKEAAALADMGLSTHAVARAMEVDWKTADHLLQPVVVRAKPLAQSCEREAWCQLACENPSLTKKELRGLNPALYARLYRTDRAWLLEWQAAVDGRKKKGTRVNWVERDLKAERTVRETAAATLCSVPPQRVSRGHLLKLTGLRALLAHRAPNLPRTCAALDEVCEEVQEFQVRRLTHVLSVSQQGATSKWEVLRRAGLQPYRFEDRAEGLIQRAASRLREQRAGDTHDR